MNKKITITFEIDPTDYGCSDDNQETVSLVKAIIDLSPIPDNNTLKIHVKDPRYIFRPNKKPKN